MLKHRYDNLSESLSDFDRMLDGMNSVQPLERQQVDEDLLAMFREEQELIRFERQIEHLYSAVYGSGMPISESEVKALQQAHAAAAAKYNDAAAATIAKIKALSAAHDTTMKEKMLALKTRFQLKAREHGTLASGPDKKKEIVASVTESTRPRARSVLGDFRRLAGIDEAVQMPRDPGLLGTTRFNAGYEKMARPFDEAEDTGHKKRMKAVAKKVHQAGSAIDREYGEDDQDEDKETVAQYQARGGKIKKVPPGEAANSMTFGQDIMKKGTTKALAAQTWGAHGHRQSMKLGRHESGDDPAPEKRGLAPRPGLHHGEKNPRPRQELVPRPGLHHGEKNPRPDPERQSESLSIEDRIREIREGRSKAGQLKAQEAMMKRDFPKRHAQWTQDKEKIVASGRKVKDDERATPRWLNQRVGKIKDDPENDEK
jgi:hypothetical protein